MTFKDYLRKCDFAKIADHIKTIYRGASYTNQMDDFEQAYMLLTTMRLRPRRLREADSRTLHIDYRRKREGEPTNIAASCLRSAPWRAAAGWEMTIDERLSARQPEEIAAVCLWWITRMGYSPEQQAAAMSERFWQDYDSPDAPPEMRSACKLQREGRYAEALHHYEQALRNGCKDAHNKIRYLRWKGYVE